MEAQARLARFTALKAQHAALPAAPTAAAAGPAPHPTLTATASTTVPANTMAGLTATAEAAVAITKSEMQKTESKKSLVEVGVVLEDGGIDKILQSRVPPQRERGMAAYTRHPMLATSMQNYRSDGKTWAESAGNSPEKSTGLKPTLDPAKRQAPIELQTWGNEKARQLQHYMASEYVAPRVAPNGGSMPGPPVPPARYTPNGIDPEAKRFALPRFDGCPKNENMVSFKETVAAVNKPSAGSLTPEGTTKLYDHLNHRFHELEDIYGCALNELAHRIQGDELYTDDGQDITDATKELLQINFNVLNQIRQPLFTEFAIAVRAQKAPSNKRPAQPMINTGPEVEEQRNERVRIRTIAHIQSSAPAAKRTKTTPTTSGSQVSFRGATADPTPAPGTTTNRATPPADRSSGVAGGNNGSGGTATTNIGGGGRGGGGSAGGGPRAGSDAADATKK